MRPCGTEDRPDSRRFQTPVDNFRGVPWVGVGVTQQRAGANDVNGGGKGALQG